VSAVQQKLLRAFSERGISVRELREASGLPIDRSTMHRKIHGDTPMTLEEADCVARVLGMRLDVRARRVA
jgi:plasmid maintenance system antidote protein VapI